MADSVCGPGGADAPRGGGAAARLPRHPRPLVWRGAGGGRRGEGRGRGWKRQCSGWGSKGGGTQEEDTGDSIR